MSESGLFNSSLNLSNSATAAGSADCCMKSAICVNGLLKSLGDLSKLHLDLHLHYNQA